MADYITRTVSANDLARLKQARDQADRVYNDALTGVDQAVQRIPALPHPPPGPDEHQITPLNQGWEILAATPVVSGWRGRLAGFVWRLVEPVFAAQQRFNSALVDHVNRNLPIQRAVPPAVDATIALVRTHLEETIRFQSHLIVYLQSVTPFVDTKDHEFAALARRAAEDAGDAAGRLDKIARGLAGGLSGLSDEVLKRYESLTVQDQRLAQSIDEMRTTITVIQQANTALQRHLDAVRRAATPSPAVESPPLRASSAGPQQMLAQDPTRSHQYAGFEDQYRGPEDEIRERMRDYVEYFRDATDVLDVGCGRGEFLELLREAGIPARGIDLNVTMVARCQDKGLDVVAADALSYLSGLPDASLGGVIATQVVEHMQPDDLVRFLELAGQRLRAGGVIVLETINPGSWGAFFDSYIRDLTHVRPVHPDTLRYLLLANGFFQAEIVWRSPYPEQHKLLRVAPTRQAASAAPDAGLDAVVLTIDRNTERLNALMFGPRDYAAVARRPRQPGVGA